MYDHYGAEKDFLVDLVMFSSSAEKKLVTLKEYVSRMKEDQPCIYYACGETVDQIDHMPQTEMVKEKGYEVLYFTEDVDEFAIKILGKYADKEFKSVSAADLGLEDETAKAAEAVAEEESKDLLSSMKEILGDKVAKVKASAKLKSHPVCMSSEGEISLDMEKTLNAMPNAGGMMRAQRVLEINLNHPVYETLKQAEKDRERLEKLTNVLYSCALLMEGMPVENTTAFVDDACDLIG